MKGLPLQKNGGTPLENNIPLIFKNADFLEKLNGNE
jgi:hypothetical protein